MEDEHHEQRIRWADEEQRRTNETEPAMRSSEFDRVWAEQHAVAEQRREMEEEIKRRTKAEVDWAVAAMQHQHTELVAKLQEQGSLCPTSQYQLPDTLQYQSSVLNQQLGVPGCIQLNLESRLVQMPALKKINQKLLSIQKGFVAKLMENA